MTSPTENYADFVEAEVSGLGRIKVPLKGHTPAERKRALARIKNVVPADVEHVVIHGDDGKPTTIVRGPLSDAEWEAVKAAAQKKERAFKESVRDEESASAKPEGTTPMAKAAAIVGDMATGNTHKPMPVPMGEGPIARLDAAAREAGDPVRDTSKPSTGGTTPMAKMAGLVGEASRVALPGSSAAWLDSPPPSEGEGSSGDLPENPSAGMSSSPDAGVALSPGISSEPSQQSVMPSQPLPPAPGAPVDVATSYSDAMFGNSDLVQHPVRDSIENIKGLVTGDKSLAQVFPNAAKVFTGNPASAVPNSSEPLSSSMPPEQVPASFQPMPDQQPPPPPPMPGSGGLGFSVKTKGGPGMPAAPGGDLEKKLAEAEGLALNAGILKAQVDNERLNQTVLERDRVMKAAAEQEQRRLAAENAMADHMKQGEFALNDLKQQVLDAGNQKIDPNRYWANKSDGQKFAAVLAGAAFGFTGQGMQWLQRLDGLVENDIRAQQADIANKRGSLNDAIGVQKNLIEMGRMRGLSEIESVKAARAAMYQDAAFRLEQIADTAAASDPARAANVLQMKADVLAKSAKAGEELFKSRMDAAYKMGSLALQQREMTWKEQMGAAGGGNADKLPQAQQGILAAAQAGLDALPALDEAIGNPDGSVVTALGDQTAKQFGWTDAKNRDISAAMLNRIIFAGIDKSVINAADQAFLNDLQSSPGFASLRKPGAMKTLRELLTRSYNGALKTAQGLRQDTGSLQVKNIPVNFTPGVK